MYLCVWFIIKSLNSNNISIDDMDVIVVAQKIISKAENRFLDLENNSRMENEYENAL